MTNDANTGIDLLALFAEVSAPDFLDKNPEIAAKVAAREAEAAKVAKAAKAREDFPCGKCRGTGHIDAFRHIANGDCFDCGGTGVRGMA